MSNKEFRVRLEDRDGNLIQNRLSDARFWVYQDFVDISLEADCREKGVRLISYEKNDDGVVGVVEWLK